MRVLLVEDEFGCRLTLSRILEKWAQVDLAMSGAEAFSAFNMAHDFAEPYDLLILDVGIPTFDGVQLATKIRETERSEGYDRAPIMIVTSFDLEEVKSRNPDLDFDEYIKKPVDKLKVIETLKKIFKEGFA